MTTVLFLTFILFAAYCRIWLRRVAKHDRVLFPLCQLRRDIMRFLREHTPNESNALSRKEYESILRLLDAVSTMIHHYNRHKTVMFNFRKAVKFSKEYRHVRNQAPPIDMTGNDEIRKFHHQFLGLLARAFLAYTPLFRFEVLLRVFVAAYRAGKAHAQDASEITSVARDAREDERRYGALAAA
ncbi:hypothetical protein [Candidatus Spongiihabitans sp.]|uniref:hypothetical protein n=1 Tax=Candidatus Spongiihabitans sp. TaxID=3101308 RepID=UPI003C7B8D57